MYKVNCISEVPEGTPWRLIDSQSKNAKPYYTRNHNVENGSLEYRKEPEDDWTSHAVEYWIRRLVPELTNYGVRMSQFKSLVSFLRMNSDFKAELDSLLIELEI